MGRELYEHHREFCQALDECDAILRGRLERPLLSVLFADSGDAGLLDETAYTQPALFALEYALAELWRAWGVTADVVLGHSVGEYAAACVAGVFSLDDGQRLIAERACLKHELPRNGRMAVVFAAPSQVDEVVQRYRGRVAMTAVNGADNTVISGQAEAVGEIVDRFQSSGIATQMLTVSHAFHSPLMEPMLEAFEQFAASIDFHAPRIPLVSNVTGQRMGTAPDAAYGGRHARNTVRFAEGMGELETFAPDVILEVGPSATLVGMGRRSLPQCKAAWLTSLFQGRNDWRSLLTTVAQLYTRGVAIDWEGFERPWQQRRLALPTYLFERSRHWYSMPEGKGRRTFAAGRGRPLHPLLGHEAPLALESRVFEAHWSGRALPYLVDHQLQGSPVMPAAAYLEQALAAAEQVFGEGPHVLENVAIQKAMFLPEGASRVAQMAVSPEREGACTFETYSAPREADADTTRWTLHACGKLRRSTETCGMEKSSIVDLDFVRARTGQPTTGDEFYGQMVRRGLVYGPHFQVLNNLQRSHHEALAEVSLPPGVIGEIAKYQLHPALLDGCLQTMAGIVPLAADGSHSSLTYLPTAVGRLHVSGKPTSRMWTYAVRTSTDDRPNPETVEGNVCLLDEKGQVRVELSAVRLQRVGGAPSKQDAIDLRNWMYRLRWISSPPAERPATGRVAGTWLILADAGQVGVELAHRLQAQGQSCVLVRPHGQATSEGPESLRLTATQRRVPARRDLTATQRRARRPHGQATGDGYESVHRTSTVEIDPLAGDDYKRLFDQIQAGDQPACRGIVHLWSLDIPSPQASAEHMLAAVDRLGVLPPLSLTTTLRHRPVSRGRGALRVKLYSRM